MKVTFVHNATVIIETPDITVLCDPWFTEGVYDGSWYHWPPVEDEIPKVDAIWVSHVHPDHYDPAWLQGYLDRYPGTQLLCGQHDPPILERVMRADGFDPLPFERAESGLTELRCIPHGGWDCDNIDSALIVKRLNDSVVNLNDCPYDDELADKILAIVPEPVLGLLPFAGAGPWPQTFMGFPKAVMEAAVRDREYGGLTHFCEWRERLGAQYTIPFAGQYALGGMNRELNRWRGIPDALSLRLLHCTFVLNQYGMFDTETGGAVGLRIVKLPPPVLPDAPMAWSEDTEWATLEMVRAAVEQVSVPVPPLAIATQHFKVDLVAAPLGTLHVDGRYLYGLLTGKYQWDNAITGSNVRFEGAGQLLGKPYRNFYNRLRVHGIADQQD